MTGIILVYIYNFYIKISTFTDILKITKTQKPIRQHPSKNSNISRHSKNNKNTKKNEPKPFYK